MAFVKSRFMFNYIHRRMLSWKRPENAQVPYPNVWASFQGKPHGDRKPINYKIQDLTEEYIEPAIEHMSRYFFIRDSMSSSIGLADDKKSVREVTDCWRSLLNQKMGLICLATHPETGKEAVASVNVSYVCSKNDSKIKFHGDCMKKLMHFFEDLKRDYNAFEMHNTDVYMTGLGLSVAPHFRGDKVGYEMLQARVPLSLSFGASIIVAAFSGEDSRYLAKKCGFYQVAELKYQDYKQNGRVAFPLLDGSCNLMVKEIITHS